MSSANTNNTTGNASRTERRLRNRSKGHVDGRALHLAMKRDSREQKFGAFERNARIISKAIKARPCRTADPVLSVSLVEGVSSLDNEWGRGAFYDGCYDNMWDLKTQRWIACRWMLYYDGGSPSSPLSPMSDLFDED